MAVRPYKEDGIWRHSDGAPYIDQDLAESDLEFRANSDNLREAYKAENALHTGAVPQVPAEYGREHAVIQVSSAS